MKRRVLAFSPLSESSEHLSAEELDASCGKIIVAQDGAHARRSLENGRMPSTPRKERLCTWLEEASHWGSQGDSSSVTAEDVLLGGALPDEFPAAEGSKGDAAMHGGHVAHAQAVEARAESNSSSDSSQSTRCSMPLSFTSSRQSRPSQGTENDDDEDNVHAAARRSLEISRRNSLCKDRNGPSPATTPKEKPRGFARFFKQSPPKK